MGRQEAFCSSLINLWKSFMDGFGNSLGYYSFGCSVFLENYLGTLFGYPIIEKLGLYELGYENNGMMILPPMALVTCGVYIWIQRMRNKKLMKKLKLCKI